MTGEWQPCVSAFKRCSLAFDKPRLELMKLWHRTSRIWASSGLGSHPAMTWLEKAEETIIFQDLEGCSEAIELFAQIKQITQQLDDRMVMELNIHDRTAPRTKESESNSLAAVESYKEQLNAVPGTRVEKKMAEANNDQA